MAFVIFPDALFVAFCTLLEVSFTAAATGLTADFTPDLSAFFTVFRLELFLRTISRTCSGVRSGFCCNASAISLATRISSSSSEVTRSKVDGFIANSSLPLSTGFVLPLKLPWLPESIVGGYCILSLVLPGDVAPEPPRGDATGLASPVSSSSSLAISSNDRRCCEGSDIFAMPVGKTLIGMKRYYK